MTTQLEKNSSLANPCDMKFNMQMQEIFQTKPRLSHNGDETFRIKRRIYTSFNLKWKFVESVNVALFIIIYIVFLHRFRHT